MLQVLLLRLLPIPKTTVIDPQFQHYQNHCLIINLVWCPKQMFLITRVHASLEIFKVGVVESYCHETP
jgi:hypothetical protein